MRKRALIMLAVTVALFVSGCGWYQVPVKPPVGAFTNIEAPLTVAPDGQRKGTKRGEATCYNALGLAAWGDCSLEAAAADGDMDSVNFCDYSYLNVLGFFQTFTIVAHGD